MQANLRGSPSCTEQAHRAEIELHQEISFTSGTIVIGESPALRVTRGVPTVLSTSRVLTDRRSSTASW